MAKNKREKKKYTRVHCTPLLCAPMWQEVQYWVLRLTWRDWGFCVPASGCCCLSGPALVKWQAGNRAAGSQWAHCSLDRQAKEMQNQVSQNTLKVDHVTQRKLQRAWPWSQGGWGSLERRWCGSSVLWGCAVSYSWTQWRVLFLDCCRLNLAPPAVPAYLAY